MAPIKAGAKPLMPILDKNIRVTRSKSITFKDARIKRKADASPAKDKAVKRSALGNITNNVVNVNVVNNDAKQKSFKNTLLKKVTVQSSTLPTVKTVVKAKQTENNPPVPCVPKVKTRSSLRSCTAAAAPNQTALKPKEPPKETTTVTNKVKTRLSNEFEKTEESLYSTCLEDVSVSAATSRTASTSNRDSVDEAKPGNISLVAHQIEKTLHLNDFEVPEGVNDFDKENWDDVFQVSHYTMDIFSYLKSREPLFVVSDYMNRQTGLTKWMRSLLVDWMVEIQESFELNHETLYLGVKLVDLYLSKVLVSKETLQLVGAAAMFIASKYDERIPPLLDDFLYICDGAYKKRDLISMEIHVLKVCNFDLGMPLSYRFLRRYARCAKITMPVLTLARFILEFSLMDYDTITISDSKLASASLYLALQMKNHFGWTKTLQYYSGYTIEEIIDVAVTLNNGLHRKPKEQIMTVRNKYSHKIFFEVAKTALLSNESIISSAKN